MTAPATMWLVGLLVIVGMVAGCASRRAASCRRVVTYGPCDPGLPTPRLTPSTTQDPRTAKEDHGLTQQMVEEFREQYEDLDRRHHDLNKAAQDPGAHLDDYVASGYWHVARVGYYVRLLEDALQRSEDDGQEIEAYDLEMWVRGIQHGLEIARCVLADAEKALAGADGPEDEPPKLGELEPSAGSGAAPGEAARERPPDQPHHVPTLAEIEAKFKELSELYRVAARKAPDALPRIFAAQSAVYRCRQSLRDGDEMQAAAWWRQMLDRERAAWVRIDEWKRRYPEIWDEGKRKPEK